MTEEEPIDQEDSQERRDAIRERAWARRDELRAKAQNKKPEKDPKK